MPSIVARSEHAAFREYMTSLQRAITAFAANAFLLRVAPEPGSTTEQLRFPGRGFVVLRASDGASRVTLSARIYVRTVEVAPAPKRWTVLTTGYLYRLDMANEAQSLVAYHWHPHVKGINFPHVHVTAADRPEQQRLHIATPHCTLLHILSFAMRDCGVRPIQVDWRQALVDSDGTMQASLDWARHVSFVMPDGQTH